MGYGRGRIAYKSETKFRDTHDGGSRAKAVADGDDKFKGQHSEFFDRTDNNEVDSAEAVRHIQSVQDARTSCNFRHRLELNDFNTRIFR
jgi:hypothetical protein